MDLSAPQDDDQPFFRVIEQRRQPRSRRDSSLNKAFLLLDHRTRTTMKKMKAFTDLYRKEDGAIGYMLLWAMGVPATVLFAIFLLRGCN